MTRLRRAHLHVSSLAIAGALSAVACGMRGPPLPPLVIVPALDTPLVVERFDDRVYVRLTVPSANTDGSEPADLAWVELYALTTHPEPGEIESRALDLDAWLEVATLVAEIPVEPPGLSRPVVVAGESESGESEAKEPEPEEPEAFDGMTFQGDEVLVIELLTPEVITPVMLEEEEEDDDSADPEDGEEGTTDTRPVPTALVSPPLPLQPRRTYRAIAISTRGRQSGPSSTTAITLADPTRAPGAPTVTYDEFETTVEWVASSTARGSAAPTSDDVLSSSPILPAPTPTRYRVYSVPFDGLVDSGGSPVPLNSTPLSTSPFVQREVVFGQTLCYSVGVVDTFDDLEVHGTMSIPSCVTPVDTFAPQAPGELIAVASESAISLVWDVSPENDVVGYRVLRGDPSGATLEPLTLDPIAEPAFRDTTVEPDARYVYAVQAVDSAEPPNISPLSSEVAETAR